MRARLVLLVAVASIAALLTVPGAASAKAPPTPLDVTSQVDCVDCTVKMVGVTSAGGTLQAVLKVTNDVTGESQRVKAPITAQQQGETCTILDLTIGPIDLFLLGIRIQTDPIHILITAQRGTLLGDLLCGLFFGPATNALVAPLNEALRQGAAALVPVPTG